MKLLNRIAACKQDKIRLLDAAFGWDYLHLEFGCYWFYLELGWMVPLICGYGAYLSRLGIRASAAFNHRKRKLQEGELIWEHGRYLQIPQVVKV